MFSEAKFAVCPEIDTKNTNSIDHNIEFINVKPGGTQSYL